MRRRASWLMVVVMFVASLVPALSQAARAASASDSGLVSVCTSIGVIWVDPASGEVREPPVQGHGAGHFERCPCCFTHAPHLPPADPAVLLLISVRRTEMPYLYHHAPRPLFAWSSAQPRAPPLTA